MNKTDEEIKKMYMVELEKASIVNSLVPPSLEEMQKQKFGDVLIQAAVNLFKKGEGSGKYLDGFNDGKAFAILPLKCVDDFTDQKYCTKKEKCQQCYKSINN